MSANGLYNPDQSAVNTRWIEPWTEAFRAQRDIGLRVPINFQTVPAVSLAQACFAQNQYEHNAFQKCFSNLLAVGVRKFTVDTYWDPLRSVWSLCPVELPQSNEDTSAEGNLPVATGPTIAPSSDSMSAEIPLSTFDPPGKAKKASTDIHIGFGVCRPIVEFDSSRVLGRIVNFLSFNECSNTNHNRFPNPQWTAAFANRELQLHISDDARLTYRHTREVPRNNSYYN